MLKEFTLPQFFSHPQTKIIRASNLKIVPVGRKALVIFLVLINTVLLFSYILGVNEQASLGYEIKALQSKIAEVNQVNKKLDLEIAEKASVADLEKELLQNGYSVINSTQYLFTENHFSQR